MDLTTTDKIGLRALLLSLAAMALVACSGASETGSRSSNNRGDDGFLTAWAEPDVGDDDLGADWEQAARRRRGRTGPAGAPGAPSGGTVASVNAPGGQSSRLAPAAGAPSGDDGWAIVLQTFTHEAHQQAAHTMVGQLASIDPQLAAARVHRSSKGSMVIFGAYPNAQDAQAQQDLEWIKTIEINGRPVFPRAMLSRVAREAPSSPYDLMLARVQHPNVTPLYTLQVAVWVVAGDLPAAQASRKAEAYAAELRAGGHEAYVYHNRDKGMSMVTVGLFDRRALSPSGLYSAEVSALLKKFPAHLVNGAPLEEQLSPTERQLQKPHLVEVPEL